MARYNRSYVSDVASYGIIYQYIQKIFIMNSRFNFRKQKKILIVFYLTRTQLAAFAN